MSMRATDTDRGCFERISRWYTLHVVHLKKSLLSQRNHTCYSLCATVTAEAEPKDQSTDSLCVRFAVKHEKCIQLFGECSGVGNTRKTCFITFFHLERCFSSTSSMQIRNKRLRGDRKNDKEANTHREKEWAEDACMPYTHSHTNWMKWTFGWSSGICVIQFSCVK